MVVQSAQSSAQLLLQPTPAREVITKTSGNQPARTSGERFSKGTLRRDPDLAMNSLRRSSQKKRGNRAEGQGARPFTFQSGYCSSTATVERANGEKSHGPSFRWERSRASNGAGTDCQSYCDKIWRANAYTTCPPGMQNLCGLASGGALTKDGCCRTCCKSAEKLLLHWCIVDCHILTGPTATKTIGSTRLDEMLRKSIVARTKRVLLLLKISKETYVKRNEDYVGMVTPAFSPKDPTISILLQLGNPIPYMLRL